MKIQIYDKYDTPEKLLNVLKAFVNMLDGKGVHLGSMVIYATTWNKETGESQEVFIGDDNKKAAYLIGNFPFLEGKDEEHKNWTVMFPIAEGCEYSQEEYRQICFAYEKGKELETKLPVIRTSKAGNNRAFDSIDAIRKANYSPYRILQAINDGTPYRNYTWTSNKESR